MELTPPPGPIVLPHNLTLTVPACRVSIHSNHEPPFPKPTQPIVHPLFDSVQSSQDHDRVMICPSITMAHGLYFPGKLARFQIQHPGSDLAALSPSPPCPSDGSQRSNSPHRCLNPQLYFIDWATLLTSPSTSSSFTINCNLDLTRRTFPFQYNSDLTERASHFKTQQPQHSSSHISLIFPRGCNRRE